MAIRLAAGLSGLGMILGMILGMSLLATGVCAWERPAKDDSVVWRLDNLKQIGGHRVRGVGAPRVVAEDGRKWIEFDGRDDALFLDVHPLAGAKRFTVEVIFRPASDGPREQRFFHMQQTGSDNRVMFETRLTGDGQWFLDTFIKTGNENRTLFADQFTHPLDRWYHAALVVDGDEMRHYVNGKQELASKINYQPQNAGSTSLGVRINRVHWFRGAIRAARFTRRVLKPQEFLRP